MDLDGKTTAEGRVLSGIISCPKCALGRQNSVGENSFVLFFRVVLKSFLVSIFELLGELAIQVPRAECAPKVWKTQTQKGGENAQVGSISTRFRKTHFFGPQTKKAEKKEQH